MPSPNPAPDQLASALRALTALGRCNEAVLKAKDEHGMLQAVCDALVHAAGYRIVWVAEALPDGGVRRRAHCGADDALLGSIDMRWDEGPFSRGPTGSALRTGRTVFTNDFLTDPAYAPWRDFATRLGLRSGIALPLTFDGATAALTLYAQEADAFDASELALLEQLAGNVAYGLKALRAAAAHENDRRRLGERVKELRCLYDISHLLERHSGGLEGMLQQLVERIPPGFQFPQLTAVRLLLGDARYTTADFRAVGEHIGVPVRIPDQPTGRLEVWVNDYPEDADAFLDEESALLTAVREQLERTLERRHTERVLRASRERLAKAQRLAHLGSWEWRMDGDKAVWDAETCRIFGYADERRELDYARFLEHVHPDDREQLVAQIAQALGGGTPLSVDYRVLRPDGEERVVHEECEVLQDEGESPRLIGTVQDITERKRAEDELRRSYAELARTHDELKSADRQLLQSEKMASIGQLAAGVAHEINNPVGYVSANLGSLEGYLNDLLQLVETYEHYEQPLPPAAVAHLQASKRRIDLDFVRSDAAGLVRETREGIARVKAIVQDLKDFSRVDEDDWSLADLHKGLDSTLNIVWNELKYKAEVVKKYGDLPPVECMPSQVNQVFLNLLVNAAHAITGQGTITLRTGCDGERAWVEVADTGRGIEPELLPRLFDPFFTTKPQGQGTGLGLALSYRIVEKHGGRIDVISTPGVGSTFTVHLPLRQATGTPPAAPSARSETR